MSIINQILVPTDFSESADAALTYAATLADQVGAAISLVHVFEDPDVLSVYSEQYVPTSQALREQILTDLRRRLSERMQALGRPGGTPKVLFGGTAAAIVANARERGTDLIVMGTHGRHGMAHLLLGSVAERVVRTAACPVLVVRGTTT